MSFGGIGRQVAFHHDCPVGRIRVIGATPSHRAWTWEGTASPAPLTRKGPHHAPLRGGDLGTTPDGVPCGKDSAPADS